VALEGADLAGTVQHQEAPEDVRRGDVDVQDLERLVELRPLARVQAGDARVAVRHGQARHLGRPAHRDAHASVGRSRLQPAVGHDAAKGLGLLGRELLHGHHVHGQCRDQVGKGLGVGATLPEVGGQDAERVPIQLGDRPVVAPASACLPFVGGAGARNETAGISVR